MAKHHVWYSTLERTNKMNLKELTDEQIDTLRIDVINEQERRQNLEAIPATIRDLASTYEAGGGKLADLHTAIDPS